MRPSAERHWRSRKTSRAPGGSGGCAPDQKIWPIWARRTAAPAWATLSPTGCPEVSLFEPFPDHLDDDGHGHQVPTAKHKHRRHVPTEPSIFLKDGDGVTPWTWLGAMFGAFLLDQLRFGWGRNPSIQNGTQPQGDRANQQNDSERLVVAFQQHARSGTRHGQSERGDDGHPSGVASPLFRGIHAAPKRAADGDHAAPAQPCARTAQHKKQESPAGVGHESSGNHGQRGPPQLAGDGISFGFSLCRFGPPQAGQIGPGRRCT